MTDKTYKASMIICAIGVALCIAAMAIPPKGWTSDCTLVEPAAQGEFGRCVQEKPE
jgi:hypothetical protein